MRKLYCLCSLVVLVSALPTASYSQSIVACYPFNGNANDEAGNNHNGAVNGAQLGQDRFSNSNSAYVFDGIDDFIEIAHHADFNFDATNDFSISLWLKAPVGQTNTQSIVNDVFTKWEDNGVNDGYPFAFRLMNQTAGPPNVNGQIRTLRFDKTCNNFPFEDSNETVNDNSFHHVVFIKSGADLKVYIDNQIDTIFGDSSSCDNTNMNSVFIGKRGGTINSNHFEGTIDDIIVYDYAISEGLIDCLFTTSGSPCSCTPTGIENDVLSIESTSITLFPNPATNQLNIDLPQLYETVTVEVYNELGQLELSEGYDNTAITSLDVNNLSKGVYIVRVHMNEQMQIKKLIIE